MRAVIVANGNLEYSDAIKNAIESYDLIIASDGGAEFLYKAEIIPSLLVGDFDSLDESILEHYKNQDIEIIKFPVKKDLTDTHLAIDIAIKRGYLEIDLFGATGSRLDHTSTNFMLLFLIEENGGTGSIIDKNNIIMVAKKKTLIKQVFSKQYVSLVAFEDSEGITMSGFKFPLTNAKLKCGDSLCVSNEMTNETAEIEVAKGRVLIFISRD